MATYGVEDIHEGLIYEERFKHERYHGGALPKYQNGCIEPRKPAMKDVQERDLRQIRKDKKERENDGG
jgi:hypothetical protein